MVIGYVTQEGGYMLEELAYIPHKHGYMQRTFTLKKDLLNILKSFMLNLIKCYLFYMLIICFNPDLGRI